MHCATVYIAEKGHVLYQDYQGQMNGTPHHEACQADVTRVQFKQCYKINMTSFRARSFALVGASPMTVLTFAQIHDSFTSDVRTEMACWQFYEGYYPW